MSENPSIIPNSWNPFGPPRKSLTCRCDVPAPVWGSFARTAEFRQPLMQKPASLTSFRVSPQTRPPRRGALLQPQGRIPAQHLSLAAFRPISGKAVLGFCVVLRRVTFVLAFFVRFFVFQRQHTNSFALARAQRACKEGQAASQTINDVHQPAANTGNWSHAVIRSGGEVTRAGRPTARDTLAQPPRARAAGQTTLLKESG